MPLAIVANVVLAALLAIVLLSVLVGAILSSHVDHRRFALAAQRKAFRDHRRAAAARPRPRTGWATRPDAS